MLESFKAYLTEVCGLQAGQRALLAVSGGLDSMVMAHLFRLAEWPHGLAHCNFRLRGANADADEDLVREYAQAHELPFFSQAFDTHAEAERAGESIQMAARRLRYTWLESVRLTEGFDCIATAHHADDNAETVLYNLVKGCGIRGLHGIPVRAGVIIRPLLFATRSEVLTWAEHHQVQWREDASNQKNYYARNRIRLEVAPVFQHINPAWTRTMMANIRRFQQAEALMQWAVAHMATQVCTYDEAGGMAIDLQKLLSFPAPETVLYELLSPCGFSPAQVEDMLKAVQRQPGAIFQSAQYRLLADRGRLLAQPLPAATPNEPVLIEPHTRSIAVGDEALTLAWYEGHPEYFSPDTRQAYLDADRLSWPLQLRRWRPGDYFYPLGMPGQRKKLQDFFTDLKLSRFDKEKAWVLETAKGDICWVVGYRTDERFRIREHTTRYVELTWMRAQGLLFS